MPSADGISILNTNDLNRYKELDLCKEYYIIDTFLKRNESPGIIQVENFSNQRRSPNLNH